MVAVGHLRFYDTTLRDGLRNSGVTMSIDERIAVAVGLEHAGIDAIEIGYGGPTQPAIMRTIAGALTDPVVYGLSRVDLRDVDRVLDGLAPAPRTGVNIFLPCSDQFLAAADSTREQEIDRLARAIGHARHHVDQVTFGTQDASRADRSFLADVCDAAIDAGATTISIADTVSYALPHELADLCSWLCRRDRAESVSWSVHCHNELGLAVANSLAAISAGARQIEGTLNGIGEGAGNTPFQAVATAVTTRADAFAGLEVSLDAQRLDETAALVADIASRPA